MEDSLKFWQLREWLTIHEAACLALNCNPSNTDYEPNGWKGFYSALGEAVELDMQTEYECDKALDVVVSHDTRYHTNLIFSVSTVKGYELGHFEDFGQPQIDDANIKVTAIKEWLVLKDIKPPFFFPEDVKQQTIITKSKPEYQTHLMTIMYKTINRYYGENYDPNDRDSVPKQTNVIQWLRETYPPLSEAEAKAIDKMTRPEQSKSPQGEITAYP